MHSVCWETFSADTALGTPITRGVPSTREVPSTSGSSSPIPSPQADILGKTTNALYRVQTDLRRSGRHVVYDKDQSKLWVLRLVESSSTDSAAPDEDHTTANIIRCHGLKSKLSL